MVWVGCTEKQFGDIPKEYSILPIGFLKFQRDQHSKVISLIGANQRSGELLNTSPSHLLNHSLDSLNLERAFFKNLDYSFQQTETINGRILGNGYSAGKLFECSFTRLAENQVGCFFYEVDFKSDMNTENKTISSKQATSIYDSLKSFKHLFHTFFNHVPVGIVVITPDGRIEDANRYFLSLFDYSFDEIYNHSIDEFIVPKNLIEEGIRLTEKALNREIINFQTVRQTKGGKELHVLLQAAPIMQDQRQLGVFLIYQDFTPQQDALERVKETGRKLEELHKIVHQLDACKEEKEAYQVTVDAASNILKMYSSVIVIEEKNKLVPKVASGKLCLDQFPIIDKKSGLIGKTFEAQETYYCGDITKVPHANSLRDDFRSVLNVPIGSMGVFQAISTEVDAYTQEDVRLTELLIGHTEEVIKRISLTRQLLYQAHYDALTGLTNRHYFNQLLDREVNRAKRYNYGLTFLMIDLDNFKRINDTLGHLAGDKVLREIAKLILENVRQCDYVVRYGGDEFLVIMTEVNLAQYKENIEHVIKRLKQSVKEWCAVQESFLRSISLSIGAAHWSPDGEMSIKEVLYQADVWMYSEKK